MTDSLPLSDHDYQSLSVLYSCRLSTSVYVLALSMSTSILTVLSVSLLNIDTNTIVVNLNSWLSIYYISRAALLKASCNGAYRP